jgi:dihydrofolate synthase/folylpolyglutamate synthase
MQNDLLSWLLIHYGQEQMRPGLTRMKAALEDLLPLFSQTKIVVIAGTNGKGETTLRLSNHLKGHSHYVWTSPHIERITERFRNQNGEIDLELLHQIVLECHEKVVSHKFELSFYEFLFLVFCTWAAKAQPEFLLLEVGLGGRLDAVNVFDADLVLLPSISRDHQEILGSRYDQILLEKLGTLREKTTLIHFLHSQYLIERTKRFVDTIGAKSLALKDITNVPSYEFSRRNDLLASAAYCTLLGREFHPSEWTGPLSFLEHRGEVVQGENEWIFFGSHNVDGLRKLIQFLHSGTYTFSRPPYDAVIVAFSRRDLQDLRVMLRMLSSARLGKVIVTVFDHPKAQEAVTMEAIATEEGSEFVQNIERYVREQNKNQRVLVTGSYYFLGHFKSLPCCR